MNIIKNITRFSVILLLASMPAMAEKNIAKEINAQPLEIRLAVIALKSCMEQYVDAKSLNGIEQRVHRAVKRVEGYCKQKNEKHAYQAVLHYSKQRETRAALACVRQLKPLLDRPAVQNLIGKHRKDVNTVLAGGIPTPICR